MGPVSSPLVIIAAGVWSVDLAAAVGLHLPVTPEPRHVWLTEPGDPLPHELPLTIDFDTGFYFQREGKSLLFGGRQTTLEELAPFATHRLPLLADLGIRPGWWGYYEMTPDHNAVIGAAAEPKGLLYGTGFSGHGFQQAPVVGEYLASPGAWIGAAARSQPTLRGSIRLSRRSSGNPCDLSAQPRVGDYPCVAGNPGLACRAHR